MNFRNSFPNDASGQDVDNSRQPAHPAFGNTDSVPSPRKGTFNLKTISDNVYSACPTEGNRDLAYGVLKYAEVIAECFSDEYIDYMVWPKELDMNADKNALPIHFLFRRDGRPVLAVVIVTANGYNTPRVVATRLWCQRNGIKYIRMHATGNYADWITGKSTGAFSNKRELEMFCKGWIIRKIQSALD